MFGLYVFRKSSLFQNQNKINKIIGTSRTSPSPTAKSTNQHIRSFFRSSYTTLKDVKNQFRRLVSSLIRRKVMKIGYFGKNSQNASCRSMLDVWSTQVLFL